MSTNILRPPSSSASGNCNHPILPRYKHSDRPNISVFKNANSPCIKNSSITVNTTNVDASDHSAPDPLQKLYDQVAQNAILNAGGRADEVRCYPGTREELIGLVERWIDGEDGASPNMMWLSGPAGAGKSAIMQTMAERCKERGVQAASFFFFRTDPTRSTAQSLVATLLCQVLEFQPPARQAIAAVLSKYPLVFGTSIKDQVNQLLLSPLQDISQPLGSPVRRPIVLLIDGLDECDSETKTSQRHILQALDYLLIQDNCPFLVLVASRAEPHITMAVKELTSPVKSIFLDDQYRPERDIRTFVTGEFSRIKRSHHLAYTLCSYWPNNEDIESIVKKSSGQFIFAATVMRYISNSSASPELSLKRVQGIMPAATNSPFAHLDAIYTYIFSCVDDIEPVMDLLSSYLLNNSVSPMFRVPLNTILGLCNSANLISICEIYHSCLSDLTAILQCDMHNNGVVFYHASLPDFLQDKCRAGEYHIDLDAFGARVLPAIWTSAGILREVPYKTPWGWASFAMSVFSTLQMTTPDITNAFLTIPPKRLQMPVMGGWARFPSIALFLHSIHRLYYPHNVKAYRKLMRQWVSWYLTYAPEYDYLRESGALPHLPYVTTCIRIHKIENWATRALGGATRGNT